jgi:hypothetical protein
MKILPEGDGFHADGQTNKRKDGETDRRTDRQTERHETNIRFRNFANDPKNHKI